jgi:hypothetical protein
MRVGSHVTLVSCSNEVGTLTKPLFCSPRVWNVKCPLYVIMRDRELSSTLAILILVLPGLCPSPLHVLPGFVLKFGTRLRNLRFVRTQNARRWTNLSTASPG